ncbi:MAG TPA: lysophospholipid acyltransferase family protein [Saprospiraceae bacterium]|nr:lysophospholipid acyltransferase family protein [Saprospiraceae bacterium]
MHVGLELDIKKYYQHLSNNFYEIIQSFIVPSSKILKNVAYKNLTDVQSDITAGKRVMILASHFSNWEWIGVNLPLVIKGECIAVYKPLSNKVIDQWIRRSRMRTSMKLAAMSEVVRMIKAFDKRACFLFIADQSPSKYQSAISINFLGQPTSFFDGPQKLVNRYDFEVYYQSVYEDKGIYKVQFFKINDQTKLMHHYAALLEQDVINDPYAWLWTHRRWKREGVYG